MIEKAAVVISTHQGYAWVKTENTTSACSACSSSGSCSSTHSFFTSSNADAGKMQVANPFHAKPGDHVIVGLPSDGLLKSSLLAYLLPLMSLIIFAFLGNELFTWFGVNGEFGSISMGIAGLFAGLRFSDTIVQHSELKEKLHPVILRKNVATEEHTVKFLTPAA